MKKLSSVVMCCFLVIGVASCGTSSTQNNTSSRYFATGKLAGEYYFARLEDNRLMVGPQITEAAGSITYYESLSRPHTQELKIIESGNKLFVIENWFNKDVSEILMFDLDNGESEVLFSGQEIQDPIFIADKKTFVINDENIVVDEETSAIKDKSSCFAVPVDRAPRRISSAPCEIVSGRIFSLIREQDQTIIQEFDLLGTSLGNVTVPITRTLLLHNNGELVSGINSLGRFEVYSTSDGNRVYMSEMNEEVTVLDTATKSDDFLISRDNSSGGALSLEVGVVTRSDGQTTFELLTTAYSASGWISADGKEALTVTQGAPFGGFDVGRWKISNRNFKLLTSKAPKVTHTSLDQFGRILIITNREVIAGSFETGFIERASGFDGAFSPYSTKDHIVIPITENGRTKLVLVENGKATESNRRTRFLETNVGYVSLAESSLFVPGYIYYSTTTDGYTLVIRQEIKDGSKAERVAEGRIAQWGVDPSGFMTYFEVTDRRVSASFVQDYGQSGKRVRISESSGYVPLLVRYEPLTLTPTYQTSQQRPTATAK